MLDSLRALSQRVDALRRELRGRGQSQVRRTGLRQEAQNIVDDYFRQVREQLRIGGVPDNYLGLLDSSMHELLEISRRQSSGTTYLNTLDQATRELRQIEHVVLEVPTGVTQAGTLNDADSQIIRTLSAILLSAARAYEQALTDLRGPERLSWRGPATDLREALRETLDHLAPDDELTGDGKFKLEKGTTGPTMKQKVRFILRKRGLTKGETAAPEAAVEAIEELVGTYVRSVYTRSSVSTHTPTEREEVLRILEYVRVALCELLEIRIGV